MIRLSKILVPTDFSEPSKYALRYACRLADQFKAEVHQVHVVEALPDLYFEGAIFTSETEGRMRETAEKLLKKQPQAPWADGVTVTHEVRQGTPLNEILAAAKDFEADLIVIGTHGRSGVGHLLLGSVAEKVIRKSPCPVLTVRTPEHLLGIKE